MNNMEEQKEDNFVEAEASNITPHEEEETIEEDTEGISREEVTEEGEEE
eukprot:CAMPEP_0170543686 /NCGR_PEP_ID=MMETSP0211-20121228/2718_1 /TAXON_ID=311385 /ORGANISM="Pseudokeronopsis sp., Strain OXSARD2" /LENGTH=48 /DNA_ID= /DNA_START= /DNA_END= /DNA_ORIENTATION=